MTTTDKILGPLFTGDDVIDGKLREAFELGIRHGADADRKSVQRAEQITTTQKILATLMRTLHTGLEGAMSIIEIPRKDRDIYRRIFGNKARQRQNSQP